MAAYTIYLQRIQPMPDVPVAYVSAYQRISRILHTLVRYAIVWQWLSVSDILQKFGLRYAGRMDAAHAVYTLRVRYPYAYYAELSLVIHLK